MNHSESGSRPLFLAIVWLAVNTFGAGAFLIVASTSWIEPELAHIPGAAGRRGLCLVLYSSTHFFPCRLAQHRHPILDSNHSLQARLVAYLQVRLGFSSDLVNCARRGQYASLTMALNPSAEQTPTVWSNSRIHFDYFAVVEIFWGLRGNMVEWNQTLALPLGP